MSVLALILVLFLWWPHEGLYSSQITFSLPLFYSCNCATCLLNSTILVGIRRFHRGILLLFSCLLLFFPNNSATTFALTKINNFALLIRIDWFCMDLTHHLIYYLILFYYYYYYYYYYYHYYYFFIWIRLKYWNI